jgi:hypothetical protein
LGADSNLGCVWPSRHKFLPIFQAAQIYSVETWTVPGHNVAKLQGPSAPFAPGLER